MDFKIQEAETMNPLRLFILLLKNHISELEMADDKRWEIQKHLNEDIMDYCKLQTILDLMISEEENENLTHLLKQFQF